MGFVIPYATTSSLLLSHVCKLYIHYVRYVGLVGFVINLNSRDFNKTFFVLKNRYTLIFPFLNAILFTLNLKDTPPLNTSFLTDLYYRTA